ALGSPSRGAAAAMPSGAIARAGAGASSPLSPTAIYDTSSTVPADAPRPGPRPTQPGSGRSVSSPDRCQMVTGSGSSSRHCRISSEVPLAALLARQRTQYQGLGAVGGPADAPSFVGAPARYAASPWAR